MESDTDKIQDFVERGNYHAAINIALSGLNEGRRTNDQISVDHFLNIINEIALRLRREFGSEGTAVGQAESDGDS